MTKHILSLSLLLLVAGGCRKKPPPPMAETAATEASPKETAPATLDAAVQKLAEHFAKVHFEFDSAVLSQGSMDALAANARILQQHPSLAIEVEGHADERGTTDYNLALGQRRAEAVQRYLTTNGVSGRRVKTVSYGEEQPLQRGSSESAWAANRRAEIESK